MTFQDQIELLYRSTVITKIGEIAYIKPYEITPNGVFRCKYTTDANGQETVSERLPVCSKPILPTSIYDNKDEAVQKVEVSMWEKKRSRWIRTIVNRSVLTNKNKVLQLADNGFPIGSDNAGYVAKYFLSVLSEHDEKLPRTASRSVMGWAEAEKDGQTETVFMPYTDLLAFDGDDTYRSLYTCISERGDRDAWVRTMKELRLEPVQSKTVNVPIRLMLAASFASPMLELIGENPFVLHLFAPTGQGKTVALMVAASVWGDPAQGKMIRSLNMTMNSMLSTAAFLNNMPFFGDELQTLKSRWLKSYDQIVMQLTEGVDRGRMQNAQLLKSKSWRNAFVFTGEDPIIKDSSGGGVVNRVVQIESESKIVSNGNRIANFVKKNYGLVAREWTDYLRSEQEVIGDMYNMTFSVLMGNCGTTDKQAGAMALLWIADTLASDLFWNGEPKLQLEDLKPFLATKSSVDIAARAKDFVINAIAEFRQNFEPESRVQYGAIESGIVWFNKSILQRIMSDAGYDFDAVKKRWKADGFLIPNGCDKYAWYASKNKATAYYVKLNVPSEDEQNGAEQTTLTDYHGDLPF